MKNFKTFLTITILLNAVPVLLSAQSGYKVIVHNSVDIERISQKELSNIFLKKKKKWSDGSSILPVDLKFSSGIRQKFTQDVHKKSMSAIKSYWQKQIFSGRNIPLLEINDDSDVVAYIKANPGSIGYVSKSYHSESVKVLIIN